MASFINTLRGWLGFPVRKRGGAHFDEAPLHPSRVPEGFQFRTPWHEARGGSQHLELYGECGPEHILHGVTARKVAGRQDCDDNLFELFGENAPAQFAMVHLTWGRHPDPHPKFPSTSLYSSFEEWVEDCMIPDVKDWGEDEEGDGDSMSVITTNRDLYVAINRLTSDRFSERDLENYLRALLPTIRRYGERDGVTPDEFIAILSEAFSTEPLPYDHDWARSHDVDPDAMQGFACCETRLLQQIVDLHEMREAGILDGEWIEYGVDAPRGGRWYNFSSGLYLECAAAGSIGGWQPGDGTGRALVPGMVAALGPDGNIESVRPEDLQQPPRSVEWITWEQFSDFLYFGQTYE